MEEEIWTQQRIKHCPYKNCKGMLLQNDFKHEELCSDCKTLWMVMPDVCIVVKEYYDLTSN